MSFSKSTAFRQSFLTLMTSGKSMQSTVGTRLVTHLAMHVSECFNKYDADRSGHLDTKELTYLLRDLGMNSSEVQ